MLVNFNLSNHHLCLGLVNGDILKYQTIYKEYDIEYVYELYIINESYKLEPEPPKKG